MRIPNDLYILTYDKKLKRSVGVHRVIMQKELGRQLRKNEVVHHINGKGYDNRIENLRVMTKKQHLKLHIVCRRYVYKQTVYRIEDLIESKPISSLINDIIGWHEPMDDIIIKDIVDWKNKPLSPAEEMCFEISKLLEETDKQNKLAQKGIKELISSS